MAHPLLALALKLEKRSRAKHARDLALSDPHLARDVGLPYRAPQKPRIDRW